MIAVDDAAGDVTGGVSAGVDGRARALVARSARARESMAHPTTRRLKASMTTQQYSLPSWVGCSVMSVTQSWLGPSRREVATDQVGDGYRCGHPFGSPPQGQAGQAGAAQQADRVVANHHALGVDQLGLDPAAAVGAVRSRVDRGDPGGEPDVPHSPSRGVPGTSLVDPDRDTQFTASTFGQNTVIDQLCDELDPLFLGAPPARPPRRPSAGS